MPHIFVSYSKQNIDFVRYLRALLENEGFTLWIDEARLTPSAKWWKAIEENIDSCGAFIIVMSPDAYESDWVEREILLAEKLKRPIFPVLLAGNPWSRLANIQYEDMRLGLHARPSPHFLTRLHTILNTGAAGADRSIIFRIEYGDITSVEADVAAFKYANGFHGADRLVAERLYNQGGITFDQLEARPNEYRLVETGGHIAASQVLYVGTPRLRHLGYKQIREFAARVLGSLAEVAPSTARLVMTTHGPGFSLDETEAFLSQFAGFRDAMQSRDCPPALRQMTIVEINQERVLRLRKLLDTTLADADYARPLEEGWGYKLSLPGSMDDAPEPAAIQNAGTKNIKPHAYVAIPAIPEMDDVFFFGIQAPIHARGLLCEYVNPALFTADLIEQIKEHIETASVVIADLTSADPRVYLQVGYAWAKNRPTILLLRNNETALLPDSIPTLSYQRIKDLEMALAERLDTFKLEGQL